MQIDGLKWFCDMLVSSGCTPEHASVATAVAGVLGVYIVARFVMRLITGR